MCKVRKEYTEESIEVLKGKKLVSYLVNKKLASGNRRVDCYGNYHLVFVVVEDLAKVVNEYVGAYRGARKKMKKTGRYIGEEDIFSLEDLHLKTALQEGFDDEEDLFDYLTLDEKHPLYTDCYLPLTKDKNYMKNGEFIRKGFKLLESAENSWVKLANYISCGVTGDGEICSDIVEEMFEADSEREEEERKEAELKEKGNLVEKEFNSVLSAIKEYAVRFGKTEKVEKFSGRFFKVERVNDSNLEKREEILGDLQDFFADLEERAIEEDSEKEEE